nr:BEN domain-containing protein 7 isoform X2 [Nothobranchius furzeri]
MEFGERKRRRKSQSFKLVTDEDCDPSYVASCKNGNEGANDAAVPVWLDESMGIKRQITGMMRLLSDKTGRAYQQVGSESNSLPQEPQDKDLNSLHQTQIPSPASHRHRSWSSEGDPEPASSSIASPTLNGQACGHSTLSKSSRSLSSLKDSVKPSNTNGEVLPPAVPEIPCCMCNCKDTLEAILQELRAMRRLMQTQKAPFEKKEQAGSPCQPSLGPGSSPRRTPQKRRPIYKPPQVSNTHDPPLNQPKEHQVLESDVRLAEDYDVFISKAQLDSILVNYTRSGSLLFRKLVCAFFDDATLANSLPNGKRKRGLNDNRKGLDQNIVGAIKVFTEKYCTNHRIEKLPGPRDWVQILQDQIKLARRRLKRDAAEAEESSTGPSTSCDYKKPECAEHTLKNVTC